MRLARRVVAVASLLGRILGSREMAACSMRVTALDSVGTWSSASREAVARGAAVAVASARRLMAVRCGCMRAEGARCGLVATSRGMTLVVVGELTC